MLTGIQKEQPLKHCRNGIEQSEKIGFEYFDPKNMSLINNKEDIDGSIEPNRTTGKPSTDISQSDDNELQPTVDTKIGFLDNVHIIYIILNVSHRFKSRYLYNIFIYFRF